MRNHPCALICAFASGLTIHLSAAPIEWRVEDGGNGHLYELVGNYLDTEQRWYWHEAKAMADARGGHLVTITSPEENQFLIDTFRTAHPWATWIGLTDSELFGGTESFGQPNPQIDGWVWVTGEPVTFTGWSPGNPENLNGEDFALIGNAWGDDHFWNDGQASWQAPFFVEYERTAVPEVAPFTMAIAWCSLVAARRFLKGSEITPASN